MSSSTTANLGYGPQLLSIVLPTIRFRQRVVWSSQRPSIQSSTKYIEAPIKHQMDSLFIAALVRAGTCSQHSSGEQLIKILPSRPSPRLKARQRLFQTSVGCTRAFHKPSSYSQSLVAAQELSQDDYKQMVDYYYESSRVESPISSDPQNMELPVVENVRYDSNMEVHNPRPSENPNTQGKPAIDHAIQIIKNTETSHDELFRSYQNLPFPGVYHLPPNIRRILLRRLSVAAKKTETVMLRYLSIVDDMKAANLPLSTAEWNSAIHLAGRSFSRVTATNVESALHIWKEMEQEADVKSDNVTFNILFDIATKAYKFVLAEMILEEMKARNLRVCRFAHVGLIYYYGLRGDGDGVRRAYRELVEGGQIVDTIVLNCVITSLLRAGELPAAEQVLHRMKAMQAKKIGGKPPQRTFEGDRELGRVLDRLSRLSRNNPERRQQLQNEQFLAPDNRTYKLFVEHHVSQTGELQRVVSLLDEMQSLGLPIHGRIFLELFRGFTMHGGIRYTSWTEARLESVWISFLQALEQGQKDVSVNRWIVVWVLRAFVKCCGKDRALEIWDELKTRWKPTERETEFIYEILHTAPIVHTNYGWG